MLTIYEKGTGEEPRNPGPIEWLRRIMTDPNLPRDERLRYRLPLAASAAALTAVGFVLVAPKFAEQSDGCTTVTVAEHGDAIQAALSARGPLKLSPTSLGLQSALTAAGQNLEGQLDAMGQPVVHEGDMLTVCVSHSLLGGYNAVAQRAEFSGPAGS